MNSNQQNRTKTRTAKKARKPRSAKKDPRWSLELAPTEWGPFKTKGLKVNSARSIGALASAPMVGLGTAAIDIQRKMPRLQTTMNENGNVVDVLTGTDLLGTITSAEPSPGDILFRQEISPSLFASTRLAQFSSLYQRYRFRRIKFVYEPIANATNSGQLLGFADFDVDNVLTTNTPENLSIGAAHQGEGITQVWQPMVFDMGQVFTFTDLYTEAGSGENNDPRLSVQGVFYILAASAISAGIPLGNVYVDYEIEFSIPFLSVKGDILGRQSAGSSYHVLYAGGPASVLGLGVPVQASDLTDFGPVSLQTQGTGVTMQWENVNPGDRITCLIAISPNDPTQGISEPATKLNFVNPAAVEGGSIGTVVRADARLLHGVEPNVGAAYSILFTATVGNTVNKLLRVALYQPSDLANWNLPSMVSITWICEPSASVLRKRRSSERKALESVPSTVEELRRELNRLAELVRVSSRASSEMERLSQPDAPSEAASRAKGKDLLEGDTERLEFHSSTSGPAPSLRKGADDSRFRFSSSDASPTIPRTSSSELAARGWVRP
jgi:hypothetical protein